MDGSTLAPRIPRSGLGSRGGAARFLAGGLRELGVHRGYGLLGGALLDVHDALVEVGIELPSFRHEAGAAFAAAEASLATGRPGLVYTTTGPGLLNSINGMVAAREEGASVILLSGASPRHRAGRRPFQDTDPSRSGWAAALCSSGAVFDYAALIDHVDQLAASLSAIAAGLERPGGFTAHLCLPADIMALPIAHAQWRPPRSTTTSKPPDTVVESLARTLRRESWALWVTHEARGASAELRAFLDRIPLPTLCTPRAKGLVDERAPGFLGVTGFGGYGDPPRQLAQLGVDRLLVLGTGVGEMESFWRRELVPPRGLVELGQGRESMAPVFPDVDLWTVRADIGETLLALRERCAPLKPGTAPRIAPCAAEPAPVRPDATPEHGVRPRALMAALQRQVVEASSAPVLTEAGNAFAWTTHELRFSQPGRYRVSTSWGSMGQATAGVVGVADATGLPAVAVVGDGAMLMHDEVSTAVALSAPAIWVVLNDARYGLVEDGMQHLDFERGDLSIPPVDFSLMAKAQGARGVRVDRESQLDDVLRDALASLAPVVIDVCIAPGERAPFGGRTDSLQEVSHDV